MTVPDWISKLSVFVLLLASFSVVDPCAGETQGAVTIYVIRPITSMMVLPDTDPSALPVLDSETISVVAALGEYEPASFVLRAGRDLESVWLDWNDLETENGDVIPSGHIDVRVVKCWYQAEGAWLTEARRSLNKVLVPELLLHDDGLVKVDHDNKANYIRLESPGGEHRHVCISDEPEIKGDLRDAKDPRNPDIYAVAPGIPRGVSPADFPVKDAPVLQPFDLKARKNKQIWLTVKVPDGVAPGLYTGQLNLLAAEGPLGDINFKLRVLPIRLSDPRTYYDPSKPFVSSIYYAACWTRRGLGARTATSRARNNCWRSSRTWSSTG